MCTCNYNATFDHDKNNRMRILKSGYERTWLNEFIESTKLNENNDNIVISF